MGSAAISPSLVTRHDRGLGAVQSMVETELSGKLRAEIRVPTNNLHRSYVPRIRLLCGQDAECSENADRMQNISWGQTVHREGENGPVQGQPLSAGGDEAFHRQLL